MLSNCNWFVVHLNTKFQKLFVIAIVTTPHGGSPWHQESINWSSLQLFFFNCDYQQFSKHKLSVSNFLMVLAFLTFSTSPCDDLEVWSVLLHTTFATAWTKFVLSTLVQWPSLLLCLTQFSSIFCPTSRRVDLRNYFLWPNFKPLHPLPLSLGLHIGHCTSAIVTSSLKQISPLYEDPIDLLVLQTYWGAIATCKGLKFLIICQRRNFSPPRGTSLLKLFPTDDISQK